MPAYWVGGVVRDILLKRPTHDLDLAVQGSAVDLARAFANAHGGAFYVMDEAFDVARVILERASARDTIDFARVRGGSIEQDLATRDLTINAMAADAATWGGSPEEIVDPFQGRSDLAARRLRAISPDVFANDPVRLLRAVRLEAELQFTLDAASAQWVRRDAALIARAPGERVRDEFIRILGSPAVLGQLRRLDTLALLGHVLPELNPTRGVTQSPPHIYDVFEHSLRAVGAVEQCEHERYQNLAQGAFSAQLLDHAARLTSGDRTRRVLLRLALVLHDVGKPSTRTVAPDGRIHFFGHAERGVEIVEPALRRLRMSGDEIELVKTVIAHHLRPILLAQNGITDRAVYRFFRDTGDAGVDVALHAWCDQQATYGDGMPPNVDAALQAVIGRLLDRYYHAHATVVAPPPLLNGRDVMDALHLPPGPRVGEILEALREAQATGQVRSRAEALDFLKIFDTSA